MNYEQAKKKLAQLGTAGRLILLADDDWDVEPLPERAKEMEAKKLASKKLKENQLVESKILARQKEERTIQYWAAQQRLAEERESKEMHRQIKIKEIAQQKKDEIEKQEFEIENRRLAIEIAKEEDMRKQIYEKFGASSEILMQYRHSGSDSTHGNEWGCWILSESNVIRAIHESKDRITFGGKKENVLFTSRNEAIKYAKWLTGKDWYSDERFTSKECINDDFPRKNPPTKEEREAAILRFKRWKDVESPQCKEG